MHRRSSSVYSEARMGARTQAEGPARFKPSATPSLKSFLC
jgi:hypothetical protein